MVRYIVFTLFMFNFVFISAQVPQFEDQTWNFGEVAHWKNDTAFFKVRNGTSRNLIFLPTYYNQDFIIMFSSRAAEPGETILVGIVYFTEHKGKFDVEVPLYVNLKPDPIHYRLKGNIKGFDPAAFLRCPAVNEGPSPRHLEKVVTLEVRDRETDILLKPDRIAVRTNENKKIELTRLELEYEMSILPGGYTITAEKKGYDNYFALVILEPYQNKFVIYLDKSIVAEDFSSPLLTVVNSDSIRKAESRKSRDVVSPDTFRSKEIVDETDFHSHSDTVAKNEVENGLLLASYKFNNIVFIIDVSASMNRNGKLDLLKTSYNTLIDALRENDKVGVITMASIASIVQAPTGVIEKDSLKSRVGNMKAAGSTNAGAALELAYKLATENFIEGGNNQIIIATDGVFFGGSLSRKQMESLIALSAAKGVHLSTVGIGTDPKAMQFLQMLSTTGAGSFVQIADMLTDKAAILEMIKLQSQRNLH